MIISWISLKQLELSTRIIIIPYFVKINVNFSVTLGLLNKTRINLGIFLVLAFRYTSYSRVHKKNNFYFIYHAYSVTIYLLEPEKSIWQISYFSIQRIPSYPGWKRHFSGWHRTCELTLRNRWQGGGQWDLCMKRQWGLER